MTKEEMKKIIQENPQDSLNELKRKIKNKMDDQKQREDFTFNELMQVISEINQDREKEIQKFFSKRSKVSSRKPKDIRNIEGEER